MPDTDTRNELWFMLLQGLFNLLLFAVLLGFIIMQTTPEVLSVDMPDSVPEPVMNIIRGS